MSGNATASNDAKQSLSGLPRRLVREEVLSEADALQALADASANKRQLISHLVHHMDISATRIANIAAQEFGFSLFDLSALSADSLPSEHINEDTVAKNNALPIFQRGGRLFVAISDPTNTAALDEIKFSSGQNVVPILVEEDKLSELIEKASSGGGVGDLGAGLDESFDMELGGDEGVQEDDDTSDVDDTPIVRFVNKVLLDAIKRGASDIHIEPYEKIFRIRFRIDGILQTVSEPPLNMAGRLTARLKVMSRMDISERRVPQDGRIKLKISKNRAIDFRVNTCPTLFGEKTVLRILDPSSAQLGIDVLGYEDIQKKRYMDALANPYGMILVTGPTGSGKTVSLYTGLNILNTPNTNISTAEDPAEINLGGINQVNVNPKAGLTFAEALKAFLRQDPDVIMVGEIRDLETASIAIKAAQTGHLVLSTLHTNDAPQTISRLMNMGVPAFNVATAVTLIIAQRLARRLCGECKQPADVPEDVLLKEGFKQEDLTDLTIYQASPSGCSKCNEGYKGRVGIYQVMPISEDMGRIIMNDGNAIDIADQAAKEGIDDLRRSALKKVMAGLTSLEEANRVTQD